MLVEFTVGNYRSFRERQTFSMEATSLKSAPAQRHLDKSNVIQVESKLQLLTSAAIYGANASGKSNLGRALKFMCNFVIDSSRDRQSGEPIGIEPFLLSTETETLPAYFEIVFFVGKRRFRYGFEADREQITSEWLYREGMRGEVLLFDRKEQEVNVKGSNFKEGRGLESRTRKNALFLSVVAQFNGNTANAILNWFGSFFVLSGLREHEYGPFTLREMRHKKHSAEILRFMKQLDIGISDLFTKDAPQKFQSFVAAIFSADLQEELAQRAKDIAEVKTLHAKFNGEGQNIGEVEFDLVRHESDGTQRLFFLSGVILETLREGRALFIDELDARLHPQMTCAIVQLFNDKESNPHGAQLIFTTHDTNLLSNKLFRRDQIWFAEKDDRGGTNLYSLAEYQLEDGGTPRNDANLEADYIRGKFGAIPFLGDLRRVVADVVAHDNGATSSENASDAEAEKAA